MYKHIPPDPDALLPHFAQQSITPKRCCEFSRVDYRALVVFRSVACRTLRTPYESSEPVEPLEPTGLLFAQKPTPSAEIRDFARIFDRIILAKETANLAAIGQCDLANSERRRDCGGETSKCVGRE